MPEKIEVGPKLENLEEISDLILSLNHGIRYVEIAVRDKSHTKTRQGITNFLTPDETKKSIEDSLERWKTRRRLAPKLGEPVYAMAEYKKVKRITIPINPSGIVLVTMDSEGFHEVIIKEIIEIVGMIDWKF